MFVEGQARWIAPIIQAILLPNAPPPSNVRYNRSYCSSRSGSQRTRLLHSRLENEPCEGRPELLRVMGITHRQCGAIGL